MSIGFSDGVNEFHTTTAYSPHETALPDLMSILTALADGGGDQTGREGGSDEYTLKWNRDPEEFDFHFIRNGTELTINIYQYPTEERDAAERELVYSFTGPLRDVIAAFAETFHQLYEDRDTDEFESNWRQPFPFEEYEEFKAKTT
ncbi:MAG TPA: hypothetical protein PKD24_00815 [Pyrinomonadaceae bacterium]|nr:hypothetical protein [Pyrinomonadaceae bacterium]HMP64303.1 hypothetical protein [Pyrinomonadaceae bacterium]